MPLPPSSSLPFRSSRSSSRKPLTSSILLASPPCSIFLASKAWAVRSLSSSTLPLNSLTRSSSTVISAFVGRDSISGKTSSLICAFVSKHRDSIASMSVFVTFSPSSSPPPTLSCKSSMPVFNSPRSSSKAPKSALAAPSVSVRRAKSSSTCFVSLTVASRLSRSVALAIDSRSGKGSSSSCALTFRKRVSTASISSFVAAFSGMSTSGTGTSRVATPATAFWTSLRTISMPSRSSRNKLPSTGPAL